MKMCFFSRLAHFNQGLSVLEFQKPPNPYFSFLVSRAQVANFSLQLKTAPCNDQECTFQRLRVEIGGRVVPCLTCTRPWSHLWHSGSEMSQHHKILERKCMTLLIISREATAELFFRRQIIAAAITVTVCCEVKHANVPDLVISTTTPTL